MGRPPTHGVWLFNAGTLGTRLAALQADAPRLSEDEIARASAMRMPVMRERWVASRIALRLTLEVWMKHSLGRQPFQITPEGRPFLPAPAPSFSLSHAGPFALVAVAQAGPIGTDIEEVSARKISAIRASQMERFAAHVAGAGLPGASEDARFIQAWTRIEAYAKADGRGVGRVLGEAGVLGQGSQAARAQVDGHTFRPPQYRAYDLDIAQLAPGYAAAVAGPADAALAQIKVCDGAELLAGFE